MQTLLERTPGGGSSGSSSKNTKHITLVLLCIALAAYIALVLLPTLSLRDIGEDPVIRQGRNTRPAMPSSVLEKPPTPPQKTPAVAEAETKEEDTRESEEVATTKAGATHDDNANDDTHHTTTSVGAGKKKKKNTKSSAGDMTRAAGGEADLVPLPPNLLWKPWGYNAERNVARWKVLYGSIASDWVSPTDGTVDHTSAKFSLVDYGSDQGFFSISIAKAFPNAMVMGIEAGGVGGSIWAKKKGQKMDVLEIQATKASEMEVSNVFVCKTLAHQDHFFKLKKQNLVSRYQLVLSVFHWFKLETAEVFQKTIVTLFLNAKTTFIELPTIGDRSALIRKQVGWDNFKVWYEGYNSVKEVIEAAAKSQNVKVKVTLLISAPWLKWTRDVFRVDVLEEDGRGELPAPADFGCAARQEIYGCAQRDQMHTCVAGF